MPLHPQAQDFIDMIAQENAPAWHERPVGESRELFSSLTGVFGEAPQLANVEDAVMELPPPNDSHLIRPQLANVEDAVMEGVPVRIYRPSVDPAQPVAIYFHGGGWVLGNLDTHDSLCRRLAKQSGLTVVAVDYRLAPEHKYPAAFDDAWTVVKQVAQRAVDFGADADRLIVAGDSAGGNLAAAVCLKARDEGAAWIRGQVLIYPVIEPDFDTESYRSFATGHGLLRETMQWFWQQYLGDTTADRRYVALANADPRGLPPAHVVTAEYDVLRDEGEHYAARLQAAGVTTTIRRYDGMLHGFVHFAGVFDDGITAAADLGTVLRRMATEPVN